MARTQREVHEHARKLLSNLTTITRHDYGIEVPTPIIRDGPHDSVDMHWQVENYELLVNIPNDLNEPASFYGEDNHGNKIKGCHRNLAHLIIAAWFHSVL